MKSFIGIILFVFLSNNILAKDFTVSGSVYDENYKPIFGVKINIEGKTKNNSTNKMGYFSFSLDDSTAILKLTKKGFEPIYAKVIPPLGEYYQFIMKAELSLPLQEMRKADRHSADARGYHGGFTSSIDFDGARSKDSKDGMILSSEAPGIGTFATENIGEAGKLTAGDINDFAKWKMWNDISEQELAKYAKRWQVQPRERYVVQLESMDKTPIVAAKVKLLSNNKMIWEATTDNTGKAELWADAFGSETDKGRGFSAEVTYKNQKYNISQAKQFQNGINFLKIPVACNFPNKAQIAFVADATGSMGDEIDYLKAELADVIQKIKDTVPNLELETASLFYRDFFDDYLTKSKNFTNEVNEQVEFIRSNSARGGGDFPEAVDVAIETALNHFSWSDDAVAKIMFLVLDAPPHESDDNFGRLKANITKAAAMGVRIVPLTCSGIDKSTEYLMRSMALLTNGTYLFLTDDSGLGENHISPTTDNFSVNLLNSLLVKTIYQFTYLPACQATVADGRDTLIVAKSDSLPTAQKGIFGSDEDIFNPKDPFDFGDNSIGWKYYPNPTEGELFIETHGDIVDLFVCDVTGKIIFRVENTNSRVVRVDLSPFPNGIYFIRYEYENDKWLSGKIILNR